MENATAQSLVRDAAPRVSAEQRTARRPTNGRSPKLNELRPSDVRPTVAGKFIELGGHKLQVCGVTYGTFRPNADGALFPERARVREDFAAMSGRGINAVRTYTVPPDWLLELAAEHGLWVLVGLPWEEHVAFLDDRRSTRSIVERVRAGVRACAGHPAILAYAVGNEIPAPIARWHGRTRVERFVERLYDAAKAEDPDGLVTYVNYPTTEYLQLQFLDFACFNVFLESKPALDAYLGRLHTLADERPLMLAEIGLDSRQHGPDRQAEVLEWQISTAFEGGCAGAFTFAWTDEWHRGGYDIEDWTFGLVDRDRRPKPALEAVGRAFGRVWGASREWPSFTIIVCTHNGAQTLPECLEAITKLDYPRYEVIVVDDGSTDSSSEIAAAHGAEVIRNAVNRGLSWSRNIGAQSATGDLIAYIDDDARPDVHWLRFLAITFARGYSAVGGPNIAPRDDGLVADCVADAPGGPVHVLISDQDAEHVPGCNMAVRRSVLEEIGGFDPQFHIAGDDVDVCWRLEQAGHTIGFSPAAAVWHHRRNSVRAYVRQQYHYGKAEALLERKWPERYNRLGHVTWSGQVYGGSRHRRLRRGKIDYGTWGNRMFQSIYERQPGVLFTLSVMPEWYLLAAVLAGLSALGIVWPPLFVALPALALLTLTMASAAVARQTNPRPGASAWTRARHRSLVVGLSMLQPLPRLAGRLRHGLSPWRRPGARAIARPWRRHRSIWSERWAPLGRWIEEVELQLRPDAHAVIRGADTDRWDLQVRAGAFASARLLCAVEEHGAGRQLVRFRSWPKVSLGALALPAVAAVVALAAGLDAAWVPASVLGAIALGITAATVYDCVLANGILVHAIERLAPDTLEARQLMARMGPLTRSTAGGSGNATDGVEPEEPAGLLSVPEAGL